MAKFENKACDIIIGNAVQMLNILLIHIQLNSKSWWLIDARELTHHYK